ncbi:MAG TPA: type II toxin-antitoxin system HicA family toxin [Actinomycetota bacterium]|nr:type II toxin-antitoxin system HicA family toxin [Actinomycetota bacterium]
MKAGANRYRRELEELAAEFGFTVERTRSQHYALRKPGRPPVFQSSTPSDWRSTRNLRSQLRRADQKEITPP